ncbi:MAG: transcription antitermination factor NusB [Paludibacteraceae bacterium]|nr:transcription antitermination factor NusB [Paludibacteraceae bacterium]
MVRTRVIQTLFAYYKDGEKTPLTAKKELINSFSDTYSLYMQLLNFVNELTAYAEQQIEQGETRSKATHLPFDANRRFVNNQLAKQIFNCRTLRNYIDNERLTWDAGMNAVSAIYRLLTESKIYKTYMAAETCSFDDDKRIWRKIISGMMMDNDDLLSALEEMEVTLDHANWTTDADVILSYVEKTIKRTTADSDIDGKLLPMFDKEEELEFGKELLQYAIENRSAYQELISSHLKNWDADRIAYMDTIILQVALAEILNYPNIAVEISLNEYIEIAKEYSTEKSYLFINGILTEILLHLKRENKLMKNVK